MKNAVTLGIFVLLFSCTNASADFFLVVDQSSLVNTSGNNWSIDLIAQLDNHGDQDLTSPPKISSINARLFFSPVAAGQEFLGVSSPSGAAIFSNASSTYGSGSPDFATEIFASVISNSAASDPLVVNNGRAMTISFKANALQSSFGISIDPNLASGTFFTLNGGGGTPVAFDGVVNSSISAVPEPSTLLLVTVGGTLFVARRRIRKSCSKRPS